MTKNKKLNIDKISNEFPVRASILTFFEKGNPKDISDANEWLDKWQGSYQIIGELSCEDAYHDYDILCTKDSYKDLPENIICISDWSEGGASEYQYSPEEYEAVNDVLTEEYQPIKLKPPLSLKEKKE